jgi:hypothetical protein
MTLTARRLLRRPWLSALVLTALVFRALVPVGYMLGVGTGGSFSVMLCPAYAPVLVPVARDHSDDSSMVSAMAGMPGMSEMAGMPDMPAMPGLPDPTGHGQHELQGNCPFAGAATGMALAPLAPVAWLAEHSSQRTTFPPDRYIPRGTIVPSRLPRGPPQAA